MSCTSKYKLSTPVLLRTLIIDATYFIYVKIISKYVMMHLLLNWK